METEVQVVYATSVHSEYPADSLAMRKPLKPWVTSGLFPQIVILSLPEEMVVQAIDINCYNVRELVVEQSASSGSSSSSFSMLSAVSTLAASPPQQAQRTSVVPSKDPATAKRIRVVVLSAYGHFCAIYKVSVRGQKNVQGRGQPQVEAQQQQPFQANNARSFQPPAVEDEGSRFQDSFRIPENRQFRSMEPPRPALAASDDDEDAGVLGTGLGAAAPHHDDDDDDDIEDRDEEVSDITPPLPPKEPKEEEETVMRFEPEDTEDLSL